MTNKKRLEEIEKKIDGIYAFMEQMSKETAEKAKKYDYIMQYLPNISLKVKSVGNYIQENGQIGVCVDYTAPQIRLEFNDKCEIVENSRFISMNRLNLLSINDMQLISNLIENAREKNKQNGTIN